jgi:hypothetical protein
MYEIKKSLKYHGYKTFEYISVTEINKTQVKSYWYKNNEVIHS